MNAPRVLLVDDNEVLLKSVARFLTRQGAVVITAKTLQEARCFLHSRPGSDVAIVDLRLPDGNGLELIGSLTRTDPATPCIAISGDTQPHWEHEALAQGASAYLHKPFPLAALKRVLRCVLLGERCAPRCTVEGGCPGLHAAEIRAGRAREGSRPS